MSEDLFDKTEFIQYFRDETEELLQQIDQDLLRLEEFIDSGRADPETVNSLFRALHTIKGSAGMLQFGDVQTLGHKLENLCDLLRKDRMPLSEGAVDILFSGRDFLTDLIGNAIDGTESPTGLGQYLERLDSFVSVYEQTSSLIEGKSGEETSFDAEAAEAQNVTATDIEAFEAEVERLLAEKLAKEQAVYVPSEAAPAESLEAAEPDVQTAAVTEALASVAAQNESAAAAKATEKPATQKRSSAHQTIRVDIERLDLLLNLVGELVINRTRISDIASTLDRSMKDKHMNGAHEKLAPLAKDLADSSALLARTTNEIQESIMKVRMVPIGQVFDRFPRLVRDVAKARGKEVQLDISGAETDLDKTIVDEVGEPLMHLLRNCVDHGIEAPDVREARGKKRAGTISRSVGRSSADIRPCLMPRSRTFCKSIPPPSSETSMMI